MIRVAIVLLLSVLTFAAAFTGSFAQAPKRGGQIVHGSVQEPDRIWGPVTGLTVSGEINQLVNGHLIEIDERLEYVPALAVEVPTVENGGVSKDGLRYTFKLRKGVKWHDGQPFTAADVAFTQSVLLNPAVDVRGRVGWNKVTKVETPDDATVVFHFSSIDAPFLDRLWRSTAQVRAEGKLAAVQEQCRRNAKPFEYAFLLDALKDEQATVRMAAYGAMVMLGRKEAWNRVREGAEAPNPEDRAAALRILGDLGDRRALPILVQAMSLGQPSVRGAAASALGELGDPSAGPALATLLHDPIPAVRAAAAVALGEIGSPDAVAALKPALGDSNPAVRAAAVSALLHRQAPFAEVAGTVRDLIRHTDPGIRASAAKALSKTRGKDRGEAIEVLRLLAEDPLPRPRIAAIRAIGQIGGSADSGHQPTEIIALLRKSLRDQDERLPGPAEIDPKHAIPALRPDPLQKPPLERLVQPSRELGPARLLLRRGAQRREQGAVESGPEGEQQPEDGRADLPFRLQDQEEGVQARVADREHAPPLKEGSRFVHQRDEFGVGEGHSPIVVRGGRRGNRLRRNDRALWLPSTSGQGRFRHRSRISWAGAGALPRSSGRGGTPVLQRPAGLPPKSLTPARDWIIFLWKRPLRFF